MLRRRDKALLYALAAPLLKANGALHRRFRAPRAGIVKVQLGPGQSNYLPGWINVDANLIGARIDVWADLRNPLPFPDASVDVIYSHHVIEHLPDLFVHFREMHRVLKPGGVFRVGGPNGDVAARKFVEADIAWFSSDFPDRRVSLGGRFENFLFCRQEHLTILTQSFLQEIATDAGFEQFAVRRPVDDTGYPALIDSQVLGLEWESTPECPHTLIVEARKPDRAAPIARQRD